MTTFPSRPSTFVPPAAPTACCVAAAGVVLSAAPLRAQSDALRAVLDTLPEHEVVRLELRDAERRPVGRVRRAPPGSLILVDDTGGRRSLPLERVRRLWSDEGSRAGRGALIGAGVGFGAGAVAGAVAFASDPTNESGVTPLQGALIFGGVVGGPSLLVGALIGAMHTDWQLRFSAEPGPGVALQAPVP